MRFGSGGAGLRNWLPSQIRRRLRAVPWAALDGQTRPNRDSSSFCVNPGLLFGRSGGSCLSGLVLMAINRAAGLVLPSSAKYLVDNVVGKRQGQLLVPLVLIVIAATAVQGVTSFALTQLLSKAAQRMIADLRRQVQAHIGRLSVAFHDANKTGALVARIMSDVEGLRNLVGTGLVEFVGSLMTAIFALGHSAAHQRRS